MPYRRRGLLTAGTVTSTVSGGYLVISCHHAAANPLATARGPYPQTAARMGARSVNSRSSTKYTPGEQRSQCPERTLR